MWMPNPNFWLYEKERSILHDFSNQCLFPSEIRKIEIPLHFLNRQTCCSTMEMEVFFFFIIFFREVKEGIQAVASEPNNMAP